MVVLSEHGCVVVFRVSGMGTSDSPPLVIVLLQ